MTTYSTLKLNVPRPPDWPCHGRGHREPQAQRQIEHIDLIGARAVGEMLHRVAEGENLNLAPAAYERLTLDLLKSVGGDSFPSLPIHAVRQ